MKGNDQVIEAIQGALTSELSAINQYFLHAEMLEDWGYERLAKQMKEHSIDEMKHAETLMERMLFLEARPNMSQQLNVMIGDKVEEMYKKDVKQEMTAIAEYNKIIKIAVEQGDNGSREMAEGILKDEEEHLDWLEAQLDMIGHMGIGGYLTAMLAED